MPLRKRFLFILTILTLIIAGFALLSNYAEIKKPLIYFRSNVRDIEFNASLYKEGIIVVDDSPDEYTPFDGSWKSSTAPFHPYFDVNCSALIHKDKLAVTNTEVILNNLREKGDIVVPSDKEVERFTSNCERFKTQRSYPTYVRSEEEREYPIAYTIVAHTSAAQVERLLRAIYQPHNLYCIHPDAASPQDFQSALVSLADCFPNVFIPSKVERVQYRGITRLLADVNCMRDLLSLPVQWKYLINLSGQEFPLKTNLEIVQQLKAFKGMNEIESVVPPDGKVGRTVYKFRFRPGYELPVNTGIRNSPPPHGIQIYTGNAYGAFAKSFVDFVVNNKEAGDLLRWMKYTWSPDENYWATLHQHPNATPVWRKGPSDRLLVKMMKWGDRYDHPACAGKYVRALCVFGVGYLYHLAEVPHLFANKFHYEYDPVSLQCLEQLLDYRANFPETLKEFVKGFPVVD
ncbi:beta-1,3-galactosyl-O-glycosyl-glycoprotein beta-1,6-N-acetylglucosaminyltransferase 4-like [Lytechinus pictus]|uniref:beta-1,3-galactosyl-O-glycosyl-glycoprotein beta-1,6-N-acetylglucosaminyltransferase 4-like n=1 Tax=Lytechinus pictus TaxID=7653 RepID=UPI0030B9D6C9